ncbi:TlpA disulfide reductase family protein [Prevotella sp. E13-27]|uniref:TlpA disulfide reductase family protein n=1 Tax=Prevotella sp. E13-27 TaxID=2938122 RepID=UPI00200A20A2|nr:TlpA disulfide reductase family protein [Prevotella sp. E13-27]MCK8623362.1 AhpC/TSA family protein [Prevotella sp. E13-27]
MKKSKFFLLSLAALAFTACQKNSYKIDGIVEGLINGDTIYLTKDMSTGIPSDTIIVKDGKFEISGVADSVEIGIVYVKNAPMCNAFVFLEPGTISMSLNTNDIMKNTVGGTKCNDGLQELNSMTVDLQKQLDALTTTAYDATATEESKAKALAEIDALTNQARQKQFEIALKNIDNELGFFLAQGICFMPETDVEKSKELLDAMPKAFSEREAAKEMREHVELLSAVNTGKKIKDFTFPTPDGTEMNVMSEVEKNELTIIDFWASWCGPCRQEMPTMVVLFNEYQEKGLGIVGVSLDEDKEAWTNAIKELGLKWPQMSDLKGWKSAAAEQFMVNSIPFMLVVDKNGVILAKGLRGEELKSFVKEKLNKE